MGRTFRNEDRDNSKVSIIVAVHEVNLGWQILPIALMFTRRMEVKLLELIGRVEVIHRAARSICYM